MGLNLTPILRPFLTGRARAARAWQDRAGIERTQLGQLRWLLRRAADTEFGKRYGFRDISSYAEFAAAVPIAEYEDIREDVMRMVHGEGDVLWPGVTRRFAQSSGTSGGKSKYIPVTTEGLKKNHFGGTRAAVAFYLQAYPESRLFSGKSFILGGSFANEVKDLPSDVRVGDLSAHLIEAIPGLGERFRAPSKKTALMTEWHDKLPRLVDESVNENIVSLSGVPSWFLTVVKTVMERKGAANLHEVWPDLEVFFHGGIAFGPYRKQYDELAGPGGLRFWENYNASEGFFAVQDQRDNPAMRLLLDTGAFYEFLPLDELGKPGPKAIPAWEVEEGKVYALVVSNANGLWRYLPGDTVRIESAAPLRITVAGRTSAFINAFGEEVMVWNTDAAIEAACRATGATVANYTAGPVFSGEGRKAHHRWVIEFNTPPEDLEEFARILDSELQRVNSDYQAKRTDSIFLDTIELIPVAPGTFDRWLGSTGRLGGQRKVPRLSNTPELIERILRF